MVLLLFHQSWTKDQVLQSLIAGPHCIHYRNLLLHLEYIPWNKHMVLFCFVVVILSALGDSRKDIDIAPIKDVAHAVVFTVATACLHQLLPREHQRDDWRKHSNTTTPYFLAMSIKLNPKQTQVLPFSFSATFNHIKGDCVKNTFRPQLAISKQGKGIHTLSWYWFWCYVYNSKNVPDSKVHGTIMGPTWVLSAPCGPHEPCYLGLSIPLPGCPWGRTNGSLSPCGRSNGPLSPHLDLRSCTVPYGGVAPYEGKSLGCWSAIWCLIIWVGLPWPYSWTLPWL